MKKNWLKWFLLSLSVLMLSGLIVPMHAEEAEEIYEEFTTHEFRESAQYYNSNFADVEKYIIDTVNDQIRNGVINNKYLEIDISSYGIEKDTMRSILTNMIDVYPELYFIDARGTSSYGGIAQTVRFYLYKEQSEIKKELEIIDAQYNRIMERIDLRNMSDLHIALVVHDYLSSTITYPYDDFLNNALSGNVWDLYGAFVDQECVCAGYAKAFQYMMNRLGIPCGYVTSRQANHAWSVVKLNGKWYHVDPTWDDPCYDNIGKAKHDYFLLSTNTLLRMNPERSDMIITLPSGAGTVSATDTSNESGKFWNATITSCYYHLGSWYYINTSGKLIKFTNGTSTTLKTLSRSSRGFGDGDSYYYNYNGNLYRYDLTEGKTYTVVNHGSITGVSNKGGYITYGVNQGRNVPEKLVKTNLHVDHTWTIQQRIRPNIIYKCTSCSETRTLKMIEFSTLSVSLGKTVYDYTGNWIYPEIIVKENGVRLGKDCYEAAFANNMMPGTATVTIKGKGLYIGSVTRNFTIRSIPITGAQIELFFDTVFYTGSAQSPGVKSVTLNGVTLTKDTDYTVSYRNNVEKGTAQVVITGVGKYSGEVTKDFVIKDLELTDCTVSVTGGPYVYTGSAIIPTVQVMKYTYIPLKLGTNYTVSYSNNVNAGQGKVTVTGVNIPGTVTVYFTIEPKDISGATVQLNGSVFNCTGSALTPTATVTDGNKTLKHGTDYVLRYENNVVPGTGKVIVEGKGNYKGTVEKTFTIQGEMPKEVVRIKGSDRFATSLEIADALKETLGISKFTTVILADGRSFADALAGSSLAAAKNAPIIMIDKNKESRMDIVKQYLDTNMDKNGTVYILGGEAAVPAFVETKLSGYHIKRLSGTNRYLTNIQILNETGNNEQEILVCNGKSFADSLSASATGKKLMLVGESLGTAQKAYLMCFGNLKITILGGTGAVSEAMEAELRNYGTVTRIYGTSRYETSVEIAKAYFPNAKSAVFAYAKDFPDGLCGGPLAYVMKSPLILTSTGNSVAKNYTVSKGMNSGAVLGGEKLISDALVKDALGKTPILK